MKKDKEKKDRSKGNGSRLLSLNDALVPEVLQYLEEMKGKLASIKSQYAKLPDNEEQSFKVIHVKLDVLMQHLQNKHLDLASYLLEDVVTFLNGIIYHLDRKLGQQILNPSREIQPLFEKGKNLLIKCGIAKPLYSHIDEITSKMIEQEQLLAEMQKKLVKNSNFRNLLNYIRNTFLEKYKRKKVFVSYAWPKKIRLQEFWTKEFVKILSDHLKDVGLIVYDDQHESGPGNVLQWFMDNRIAEVDHVLVIATRTMAAKYWRDSFSGACNEYTDYIERFRKERGERFIIPVLLNKQNNSPGLVRKFAELSFYEEGYLNAFLNLVDKIYGLGEIDREALYGYAQLCSEPPDPPLTEFLNQRAAQDQISNAGTRNSDEPLRQSSAPGKNSSNSNWATLFPEVPTHTPHKEKETGQVTSETEVLEGSVVDSTAQEDIEAVGIDSPVSVIRSHTRGGITLLNVGKGASAEVVRAAKNFSVPRLGTAGDEKKDSVDKATEIELKHKEIIAKELSMKTESASIVIKDCYSGKGINATIVTVIEELRVIKAVSDADRREYEINWWGVPIKNPNFIARTVPLEQLQQYFFGFAQDKTHLSMAVCYGLGGIGKAQIAVEFIYQHLEKYQNIFWFCAKDEKTLQASYLKLAKALGIDHEGESKAIDMLKGWINAHPRCLLIYEKVPQHSVIENYLPNNADVLCTSRYGAWPTGDVISIKITTFNRDQCKEYIKKALDNRAFDTDSQIDLLATMLDYFPFACAQACAFMHKNKVSIPRYVDLYEEKTITLLSDNILPVDYHGEPIFSLWDSTLHAIAQKSPLAIRLLYLCNYLHHADISYALLKIFAELPDNNPHQELVEEARGLLHQYSFFEIHIEQKTISLSPFVQHVLGFKLSLEESINYCELALKTLKKLLQSSDIQQEHKNVARQNLLKHLKACHLRIIILLRATPSSSEKEILTEKCLQPTLKLLNDYYPEWDHLPKQEKIDRPLRELPSQLEREKTKSVYNVSEEKVSFIGRHGLHHQHAIEQKLKTYVPDNFQLGVAVGEGDCFFDSVAQELNQQRNTKEYTIKSLRLLCEDYVKRERHDWIHEAIRHDEGGEKGYQTYLVRMAYTAEEVELMERQNLLRGPATWGRYDIEGRIICEKTGIRLHVIEIHEQKVAEEDEDITELRVDGEGVHSLESMQKELYLQADVVHIVVYHNHFVPLSNVHRLTELAQSGEDFPREDFPHHARLKITTPQRAMQPSVIASDESRLLQGILFNPSQSSSIGTIQFPPQIFMEGNHAGRNIEAFIINRTGKLYLIKTESDITAEKKTYLTQFWNIPRRNPHFTGRERLLQLLTERLHPVADVKIKPVVITPCHGLGGVGKTQLIVEYIYRHFEEYEMVCFIPAEDKSQIEATYVELARDLNIIPKDGKLDEIIYAVKTWFLNHPNSLLVFDGAPKHSVIEDFLPQTGNYILITSRYTEWLGKSIEVGVFSLEEAREYIQKIVGKRAVDSVDLLNQLANTVGCLPLALAQAAAYIKLNNLDIAEYLALYEQRKTYLLSKGELPTGDHHPAVYVTWDITMEAIKKESTLAPHLLTLCSYLSSEGIPKTILEDFTGKEGNNPQHEIFDTALGVLNSYSMIVIHELMSTVAMHSMVQTILLEKQTAEVKKQWLQTIADIYVQRNAWQFSNANMLTGKDVTSNLSLHISKLLTLADQLDFVTVSVIRLSLIQGNFLLNCDTGAEQELRLSLKMTNEREKWRYQAIANEKLGACLLRTDNIGSLQFLTEALQLRQQLYGESISNELISSHCALGVAYYIQNNIQQSVRHFEYALQMIKQIYDSTMVYPHCVVLCVQSLNEAYAIIGDQEKQAKCRQIGFELSAKMMSFMSEAFPAGTSFTDQNFYNTNKFVLALQNNEIEYFNSAQLYERYFRLIMNQVIELNYPVRQSARKMVMSDGENIDRKRILSTVSGGLSGTGNILDALVNFLKSEMDTSKQTNGTEVNNFLPELLGFIENFNHFFKSVQVILSSKKSDAILGDVKNLIHIMPAFAQELLKMMSMMKKQMNLQQDNEISDILEKFYDHTLERIGGRCELINLLEAKMNEDESELEEIIKLNELSNAGFDKRIIVRFEEAGKRVLSSADDLKKYLQAIAEFLNQLKKDTKDVNTMEENINKAFVYPIRELFFTLPSVDTLLLWMISFKETRPDAFKKEMEQAQAGRIVIEEQLNLFKTNRKILMDEILDVLNQHESHKQSEKGSEDINLLLSTQIFIYILLLKNFDKAVIALERIKLGILVVNYIVDHAATLTRIELEDFCSAHGIDRELESVSVEDEVVAHYSVAINKTTASINVLLKYLDEENQRTSFGRIIIPRSSEIIYILKEFKDSFGTFSDPEYMEFFLQLFKIQMCYRKSSLKIIEFIKSVPHFKAYLEQIITFFNIFRRRMVLQVLPEALQLMKLNAHQKEILLYQKSNLVLRLVELLDVLIFHFEELKKHFNIISYILTKFPSSQALKNYLHQYAAAADKENKLVLRNFSARMEFSLTRTYDRRGTLSPKQLIRLNEWYQVKEKFKNIPDQIECAQQNRDLAGLIEYHEAITQLDPENYLAYHNLGFYYHIRAQQAAAKEDVEAMAELTQKAETMYRRSLTIVPRLANVASYANFLCRQDRYGEAMLYLFLVIELKEESDNEKLQCDIMGQCVLDNSLQKVVEERGHIIFEASLFTYYLLVKCLMELEKIQEIEHILPDFITEAIQADDYISYFFLAQSCYLFNQEIAIPYDAKAEAKLGDLLLTENKFESALVHYERSISLAPDCEVFTNLARLYHHVRENYQLAEHYFKKAFAVNQNTMLCCSYALLLINQNRLDEAVVPLTTVTFVDDDISLSYGPLEKRHLDNCLQQEINGHGKNTLIIKSLLIANYWLIHCYHQLGNTVEKENAMNALKVWVERNPQPLYYRILSYAYQNIGEEDEAEEYFGLALSLDRSDTTKRQGSNGEDDDSSDDKRVTMGI